MAETRYQLVHVPLGPQEQSFPCLSLPQRLLRPLPSSPRPAACRLVLLTLPSLWFSLPVLSASKNPCAYVGPTCIIHSNLPISSLSSICNHGSRGPCTEYPQVPGVRNRRLLGPCHNALGFISSSSSWSPSLVGLSSHHSSRPCFSRFLVTSMFQGQWSTLSPHLSSCW